LNNFLSELNRFVGFLHLRPNADELCKKLLIDFLTPLNIKYLGVFALALPDKLDLVSTQGIPFENLPVNLKQISVQLDCDNIISHIGVDKVALSLDQKKACAPITNGREDVGLISSEFFTPLPNESTLPFQIFMGVTSHYLFPKIQPTSPKRNLLNSSINPLTPRQRLVLQGFIEGRTNHELSLELGFSISTIRHETMSIFKALGVSDRKEAAKIAQEQNLI
jgi:DNA-binding CsgD family transcriptional regulator